MNPDLEHFVHAFADAWSRPDLDRFTALWHPEIRLTAPLAGTTVGHPASREAFRRTLELLPDMKGEVTRWSGSDDLVFIEWTASATYAGESVSWPVVDRWLLADGLGLERVAYFDSLPLVRLVARHPAWWARWWRSGLRPR